MTKLLDLLKLLPALITAVMALVKAFEVPGYGEQKKNAVLLVIELVFDTLSSFVDLPLAKEKIIEFVNKAIDAVVAFLNAVNIFKHGETVNPS